MSFERKPLETKGASIAEQKLAIYIRKNRSKLDTEIKIRLNGLDDPARCASFAKSHLMQLERHNCSPPADLVRILQVIAQVPDQEGTRGHDETKRQTVRWRNSGIRLRPTPPFHLKRGIASQTKKYLCHCSNIALCIPCTRKSANT